mgnify:CR=1 FL=1
MRGSRLGLFHHEINKKKLQFILKRNIDISLDRTNCPKSGQRQLIDFRKYLVNYKSPTFLSKEEVVQSVLIRNIKKYYYKITIKKIIM